MNCNTWIQKKRMISVCLILIFGSALGRDRGYRMEYTIKKTWDNRNIDHEPVKITLSAGKNDSVRMEIQAPYFKDPVPPGGKSGEPYNQLWNYEVVEAFFLGMSENYLEVEFSPHGHHLILLLSGARKAIKSCLPCEYKAQIYDDVWQGEAIIPAEYFPPGIKLFNAYAIHGPSKKRVYEALYPVPTGHFPEPNFHLLEYFRHFEFTLLSKSNLFSDFSDIWKDAKKNPSTSC